MPTNNAISLAFDSEIDYLIYTKIFVSDHTKWVLSPGSQNGTNVLEKLLPFKTSQENQLVGFRLDNTQSCSVKHSWVTQGLGSDWNLLSSASLSFQVL